MQRRIIAIDGPSASGKSTVARRVAEALRRIYVDSGAVYRGITWKVLREKGDPANAPEVIRLLHLMRIEFRVDSGAVRMCIDGEDPGDEIRSPEVHERVSDTAAIPEVRREVSRHLREMTRFGDLVMEGRDIGSVVFPDADFKFYLDASAEERARRRHREFAGGRASVGVGDVMNSLSRRDAKDSGRTTAPLTVAPGATVLDTTKMGIDQVVNAILGKTRKEDA